jgi:hypothetical protein
MLPTAPSGRRRFFFEPKQTSCALASKSRFGSSYIHSFYIHLCSYPECADGGVEAVKFPLDFVSLRHQVTYYL